MGTPITPKSKNSTAPEEVPRRPVAGILSRDAEKKSKALSAVAHTAVSAGSLYDDSRDAAFYTNMECVANAASFGLPFPPMIFKFVISRFREGRPQQTPKVTLESFTTQHNVSTTML
jgi:hypothetical protein